MAKRGRRQRTFPLDPPGPEHLTFNLDQACVAELEGAIDLLVRFQNLAAAHLLASAATELLRQKAKKQGVPLQYDLLDLAGGLSENIRLHMQYALSFAYKGLKHSSGSDDNVVYFRPEFVKYHLLMAVDIYFAVFKTMTVKMSMFRIWALFEAARDKPAHREGLIGAGLKIPVEHLTIDDLKRALEAVDQNPRLAEQALVAALATGASPPVA